MRSLSVSASPRTARWFATAVAVAALAGGLSACSGGGQEADTGDKDTKDYATTPLEVKYEVPEGFAEAKDGEPLVPLAEKFEAKYFDMDDVDTTEQIFIISYVINVDTSNLDRDGLIELVQQYDTKVDNQGEGLPYLSLANGHEGLHKWTKQEAGDDAFVVYDSEFFFKDNHLVQVGCQYDKQEKAVAEGCHQLLKTLDF
jgi:hypothetical protein